MSNTSGAASGPDSVLADMLADLVNSSLDLDPASRARLSALEGRAVQIVAELPAPLHEGNFTLAVQSGRLRLFPHAAEHPQVVVRGPPPDLAAWFLGGESTATGRVTIEGDSMLLAELRTALRSFRPDLIGPLRRIIGGELAEAALGTAELALAAFRSALEGAGQAVRSSAARAFVDRAQTERFLDDLDDLRLRVDRLRARVQAQEQSRTPP